MERISSIPIEQEVLGICFHASEGLGVIWDICLECQVCWSNGTRKIGRDQVVKILFCGSDAKESAWRTLSRASQPDGV